MKIFHKNLEEYEKRIPVKKIDDDIPVNEDAIYKNGYKKIAEGDDFSYYNPKDEKITEEQFENLNKVDPWMACDEVILFLRTVAHITKETRNLPSFTEVRKYIGQPNRQASHADDELSAAGVVGTTWVKGSKNWHQGFFIYLEAGGLIKDVITHQELSDIYNSIDSEQLKMETVWK